MLVLTRRYGEWISIGGFMFLQVLDYKEEGKHSDKLKVRVIIENESFRNDEFNKYLTNSLQDIGYSVGISFLHGGGSQYKIGIDAPSHYEIYRMDDDGGVSDGYESDYPVEEVEAEDELKNKYADELSWFYR